MTPSHRGRSANLSQMSSGAMADGFGGTSAGRDVRRPVWHRTEQTRLSASLRALRELLAQFEVEATSCRLDAGRGAELDH